MSWATTKDNIRLHYEEAGTGTPIVFVHEFAGDWRAWEPQMRHFSRRHRCLTYSARGYLPSEVPKDVKAYSQENAVQDILAVMDAAKIDRAHIVGLSMGGFATLHFGLTAPERALSLTVAGAGYAAEKSTQELMRAKSRATAEQFEKIGAKEMAKTYALGATRVQLQNKSPRGWQEFATQLGEHDSTGAANTMRGVQASRPSIYDFEEQLKRMQVPTLVINGDEDDQCIQPGIFLKKTIPACGLLMLPKTGHTINLEEPDWFNLFLADFIATVEAGRWDVRDPRSLPNH
ncbi:alpha/beta hydrolase [Zwartia sp.]|uniref:alpha/beta fold hydrolase n=1 Tax=Zwartia sp. TaxID=2978004 RepID=UPI00272229E2|nr:alpha/beta hydrolase [Zwartia sp.]MDO9024033.1 alpha/beta hydrolase [Zwartia sp.]